MKKDKVIAPTLKEWHLDEDDLYHNDLTDKQFYELLSCLFFKLKSVKLENDMRIFYLEDLQGGNNNHIEQDIFFTDWEDDEKQETLSENIKDQIVERLDTVYLTDYFIINNAFDD